MGLNRIVVTRARAVYSLLGLLTCLLAPSADAAVDLRISSLTASCGVNSISLDVTFENAGSTEAGGFVIAVYASIDDTIEPTDILLARSSVGGLAAGDSDTLSGVVGPPNVVPGIYTIGAILDADGAVEESDETNNRGGFVQLEFPCLHGEPDITIARLHVAVSQPNEVKATTRMRAEEAWSPSLLIVRVDPSLPPAEARAVLMNAGARIVPYRYLPGDRYLIARDAGVEAKLAEEPRIVQVYPASRAIEEGRPTIRCSLEEADAKFVLRGTGWDGPGRGSAILRYHLDSSGSRVSAEDFRAAFETVLEVWGSYADIVFEEIGRPGEERSIDVGWATRDHGDGTAFDGIGGIVAHSFYPDPISPEPIAGDLHIDAAENWGIVPGQGLNLFSVLLHEVGHCLGLNHSTDPHSVMFPQILVTEVYEGLGDDDIAGIQTLYAPAPGPDAFNISNTGTNTLIVTSITPDVPSPWLGVLPGTPFSIPPGATQEVRITVNYALAPVGITTRRLLIASNDHDKSPYPGGVFVEVTSAGTAPPSVVIGSPSTMLTRTGPVTFPVAYPGAETVSLSAEDVAVHTTGNATAEVEVEDAGGSDRVVKLVDISGNGTVSISILAGTAANMHGAAPESEKSAVIIVDNNPPGVTFGEPQFDALKREVILAVTYKDAAAIALAPNHVVLTPAADAMADVVVKGSGTIRREIVLQNIRGSGLLGVGIAPGSAQDAAGNLAPAGALATPIDVDALVSLPRPGPGNGTVGCAASAGSAGVDRCLVLVALLILAALGSTRRNRELQR